MNIFFIYVHFVICYKGIKVNNVSSGAVALPLYTGSASIHGLADFQKLKLDGELRSFSFYAIHVARLNCQNSQNLFFISIVY